MSQTNCEAIYEASYARIMHQLYYWCDELKTGLGVEYPTPKNNSIIDICDTKLPDYSMVIGIITEKILSETAEIIMRLFEINNIEYRRIDCKETSDSIVWGNNPTRKYYMSFYREEDHKKIGYVFSTEHEQQAFPIIGPSWISAYKLDGIKEYRLLDNPKFHKRYERLSQYQRHPQDVFAIQDLFDALPNSEYETYKRFIERLNTEIQSIIGYKIITMPDAYNVSVREKVGEELLQHNFVDKLRAEINNKSAQGKLPNTQQRIEGQLHIIDDNYRKRNLYRVLLGTTSFAESFISSEWYYRTNSLSMSIEQTAVAAGYIKSVEQLLYEIVSLWKGKTLSTGNYPTIKRKAKPNQDKSKESKYLIYSSDSDEKDMDLSLGSLIGFIKYNGHKEMWETDGTVRGTILDQLESYKDNVRNGFFHKHNVSASEIDEIREQTMFVHYLLLGALKISEKNKERLGFSDANDFTYSEFEQKLDDILRNLRICDDESCIYFFLSPMATRDNWRWNISVISYEKPEPIVFNGAVVQTLIGNMFSIVNNGTQDQISLETYRNEETSMQIICDRINEYLHKGHYASIVKSYNSVTVGRNFRIEATLYTKHQP